MLGLLGAGIIFTLISFLGSEPLIGWFAIAGMLLSIVCLLYGLVGLGMAIVTLAVPKLRRSSGVLVPTLTILVAVSIWFATITAIIQSQRLLERRSAALADDSRLPEEHWRERRQPGGN